MTALIIRIARHHRFAVLGLACAALALACLAVISFPPTFDIPVTKANLNSGHLWTTVIPQKIPRMLRHLYKMSNGDIDGDRSAKLTEDGRPLGPGGALHEDIRQMGQGRYSHWGGALYFSTSDNSDPNTNGRKYILRTTASARGYIYGITPIAAGLALLFFCLYIGNRIARHDRFAVLGLACAALALACLAFISFPPTLDMPVTKANLHSGHLWTTVISQKIPGTLRPLYRISNGDIDGDRSAKLTEDERPLGPGGALHEDIRQMGQGRYSHWGGALYFSTSDNSDRNTNGRKYILRTTASARGYKYGITPIAAGLALLFFCLYIGKLTFTELWLIGKGLPAELWRSAKKHHLALQELGLKPASVEKKQNRSLRAYSKLFFRLSGF